MEKVPYIDLGREDVYKGYYSRDGGKKGLGFNEPGVKKGVLQREQLHS